MIKFKLNLRLFFLIKILIAFLIISFKSYANDQDNIGRITVGSSDAAVKIKVFSSLTCPHCANFHIQVISKIKKNYIESGKVQLIFIDFPLDQAAFNASKLLHCVDQNLQMKYLDKIYEKQNIWTNGDDINAINNNLKKIVKDLGINSNQFDKCITNEKISDKILNERIDAAKKYSIEATPTIIINEKKLEGSTDFKNIKKKIERLI